jgi:anti-anti-sigma factor
MTDLRRVSRADRRRQSVEREGEDRREPPATSLTVYSQVRGNELQLFVQAPLTADNCQIGRDIMMKHCQRAPAPVVVVDLYKATYVDTPGLSVVFDLKQQLATQGRTLILQNPSRCVLRMLNITRMNRIFSVRNTSVDVERIPGAPTGAQQPIPVPPAVSPPAPADVETQD